MVTVDIGYLIRCATADFNNNPNGNFDLTTHDPCNFIDANTDANTDADFDGYTDANANPDTDVNPDSCVHADADNDGYTTGYANIYAARTGRPRSYRPTSREHGDSQLGRRGRRSPLRTMVVDFSRGLGTDRPRQPDRHELYPHRTVSRH